MLDKFCNNSDIEVYQRALGNICLLHREQEVGQIQCGLTQLFGS